jgi:hypothetical protein
MRNGLQNEINSSKRYEQNWVGTNLFKSLTGEKCNPINLARTSDIEQLIKKGVKMHSSFQFF